MIPELFRIGSTPVTSYGVMLASGFLCAYFLLEYEFKSRKIPKDFAFPEIVLGLIGAFVGAKSFHVIDHWSSYQGVGFWTMMTGPGNSWYGGFLLAAILIIYAGHRKGIHWSSLCDASAPAIAIGYGFGRVGCVTSGDGCYGEPCAALGLHWPAPLCMSFPIGQVPTTEVVLNTPLIEVFGAIVIFGVLMMLRTKMKKPAALFGVFIIIHALFRFPIEFVRINPKIGFSMSQAQWISVLVLLGGIYLVARKTTTEVTFAVESKKAGKKR